ncbi:bacterio-opsin activator domain-containing protein [Halegenticoccus soli]|uniref:bacterio-opsin activator domain-containing protein n=1 Tax=Halegenticoccus soli TaxID=1985678 RepID=UPI00117999DE|nr:bacterio-opsin activator domain-containing protein [Halegenticoccus soli]
MELGTHPFAQAGLDALPTQTAILDRDGTIVYTNRAWRDLADRNGIVGSPGVVGDSYLTVCDGNARDDAATAARGVRTVLSGERDEFSFEYPCHGPDERRWFTVRIVRFRHESDWYALVHHLDVTERKLGELRVERRNRQFRTVNRIGILVREIVQSLFDVETRDELEGIVCSRLADSAFSEFVWIAARDPDTGRLRERTSAGGDGDAIDRSGVGAAFDDGSATVVSAAEGESVDDPVLSAVVDRGYRSYVAVPIRYRNVISGALVVHAAAADAFDASGRSTFEVLGETIGYAINAIENRRLLYADYVNELAFRLDGSASFLAAVSDAADCEIELTGFVPVTAGSVLKYLTVRGASAAAVRDRLRASAPVENVTVVREYDDGCRLECTVAEPSIVLTLADRGATVRTAVAAEGEMRLIAEAPSNADVNGIVAAVRSTFDGAELTAKREVRRPTRSVDEYWSELEGRLTDRQLSMLSAAYYAGYFEWPRERSGEDIAASFDISAATFHEHVRVGLSRLLALLFEREEER